ncbi:MAG: hypothetical protein LUP95_00145 [Euryarchaeota archaeon]|nr:hypothetical protein [Euryarchaeota archaeon]
MNKIRLTVGIRRGIYDSEREMFSVPICFDSEESAQRALKSISEQLAGLNDVAIRIASQNIVTVRPETYESYDEAGSFPRLYEARKEQLQVFVIQVDLPDETKMKDTVKRVIDEHNLQIIDEGVPAERTLVFLW